MRINKIIFFIFIFIFPNLSFTSNDFFSVKLPDLDNKSFSFSTFEKNKATVIIFLLSDCPASQSYTLTLNKLAVKYSKNNISFAGVFPGQYSTDAELKKFKQQYKVSYQLLKDPEMILAKKLSAEIAPSCFVINDKGAVVYKGRIDDWMFALGKKKQVITENNLDDALTAVIKNVPVKVSETKAIGCILEYDN